MRSDAILNLEREHDNSKTNVKIEIWSLFTNVLEFNGKHINTLE